MSRKKISTTVYLTEEQVDGLKVLSEKNHVPVAEYIRMGIDKILDQYKEHLPGQMSLFEPTQVARAEASNDASS